jgi:hypothetical protein
MTEQLFPSEQIDLQSQQVDPVVQVPNQDPPYKKKVYDILSTNFDDFKLTEDDFYKKLASDKTYAGKVHKVLVDNFEDFTKPADKFVVDLTFEEPVKKKDGTQNFGFPQYDFLDFGQKSSRTLLPLVEGASQTNPKQEGVTIPFEQIDLNQDPITLAKKSTKLETGKDDAYSAHLKGLQIGDDFIDAVKNMPVGYESSQDYNTPKLLNLYKTNPQQFYRTVGSLIWQTELAGAMQQKINEIRGDMYKNAKPGSFEENHNNLLQQKIEDIKADNESFISMNKFTGADKKKNVQEISSLFDKYIDNNENKEKAKSGLIKDYAIEFGGIEDIDKFNKLQAEESSGGLSLEELMAIDYLKNTNPKQAEFYNRILLNVDKEKLANDETAMRAYEKNKQDLQELGVNLIYTNAKENLDELIEKGKKNGGILSDQDFALYKKYENLIDRARLNSDMLNRIKGINDPELEVNAQEAIGQRYSTPSTIANSLLAGFAKTGSGILHYGKTLFQDEKSANVDLLSAQEFNDMFTKYTNLNPDKGLYNNSKLVISPELQSKIDEVKLSDKSQDEKIDEVKNLMSSNRDKWNRIKVDGSFNITPSSVVTSVFKLGADIAPYLVLEAASGGGATSSVIANLAKTFGAVAVTSYQDLVANAMKNKDPHPEDTALANIAINTIAFTVGGIPSKIKAKAGTNTVIGKIINQMDDKAIVKALENRPATMTDFLLKFGKKSGNAIVSSGKSALGMQGALAGAEILKGADVNSDFAKEQIAQYLNFTLFGAVGLSFKKTPDIKTESREALFLASQNPEALIRYADKQVKSGKITSEQGEQIKNNINGAKKVYDNLPKTDANGNPFNNEQLSNLMSLKIKESYIEKNPDKFSDKDLADVQDKIDELNKGILTEDLAQMEKVKSDERDKRIEELENIISNNDVILEEKGRGTLTTEARNILGKELDNLKVEKAAEIENAIPFADLGNKPEVIPAEEVKVTEDVIPTEEVKPTEVKAEVEKNKSKEPVIVVHGTGDNGFVLEHSEGVNKEDIVRPEDARYVTRDQVDLTPQEKNELNKTGSLVKENKALDNGDKKVSIFTKHSDVFGRAGGSRFDIVIPENNSSTAEGVKDVLDKLYDENIIKNRKGSEYIKEAVKRVKDYIDANKIESAKEKPVKAVEGEKAKSERVGGIEPELPKGGTTIVTETGLTEKERQDKIEERKRQTKITDEVDKRNKLVQDTKSFYTRNKRQRNSSEGLRELNKLRIRARELGLEIDDRLESVIKKTGARRTKIKYNAKAEGDATIENGKTLYERNRNTQKVFREMQDNGHILDFKDEFGTRLSDAQIDATIQDIMDGVNSKRANRYLDQLEEAIKKDEFPIYDKAFGEFNPRYEELMNLEKEIVGEPMDEVALNKFLDEESKLTPEEDQQLTDNIENLLPEYETEPETGVEGEIQQTEPTAKEGVLTETKPIAENAEAGKPAEGQNYNELTKNAKRRIINSKFDEIIKELKIEKIC